MERTERMVCVILAGGEGKRMASAGLHKVCFPVLGRPAIVRAIDTYKKAGLRRFLVVVGQKAEQVIATVSAAHPEVAFVFQGQPRGTGHAALIAAEAMAAQNFDGDVLIVMGDKITRPPVARRLIERFEQSGADVAMATLPKTDETGLGRIARDAKGRILGIVEAADIRQARKSRKRICVAGQMLSAAQIERRADTVNGAMYVFRFAALHAALQRLRSDNSQGELYLTDTVEDLARKGGVEGILVADPEDLMAFNTPAELVAVEEAVRKREKPPRVSVAARRRLAGAACKPAGKWLAALASETQGAAKVLRRLYGQDEALIAERRREMARLAKGFVERFGADRQMILVRAPGRINLMGRHVDHRGGYVNVMAISREVLLAASPRPDDLVTLANLRSDVFPPRKFQIADLLREASWAEWIDFVASKTVRNVLNAAPGDWSHYARAPLLRLQHECSGVALHGMDCLVSGNIPMGAGLSSSSAMVVAFAEAAVAVNGLDVAMRDFVDLCGEGEWFVGSRGGSADHAAIRTSRRGSISRIGFFPFRLEGEVRFPSNLKVVIAHSGRQAVKSAEARHVFNQRVACYEIAQMLLRHRWPVAGAAEHLRDLTPDRLHVRDAEIYSGLTHLPERPTRAQLKGMLPKEDQAKLERLFDTHRGARWYDLRGAALFGISECVRSDRFRGLLEKGRLDEIGRDMRTSHDGDRIVRFDPDGKKRRFLVRTDNAALEALANANSPVGDQPGRYACSTEAIDHLVDVACAADGVVGAQLAGAGLGGCMMIVVRTPALNALLRKLRQEFYAPQEIPFEVHVCVPVAGAGLVRL